MDYITKRQLAGLIIKDPTGTPNNPPVWDSQPSPVFIVGTASNYEIDDLVSDPDLDSITVSLNTGTASLPSGVTWNDTLDRLEYDGAGIAATTTGHIATASDGTDTTDSNSFSIVVQAAETLVYPLTATGRGASRSIFQDGALSDTDRIAVGIMDASQHIGLDSGEQMDTTPPAANYISRAQAYTDILAAHPTGQHYIFTYHNVTEAFEGADAVTARHIKIRDYLESLDGPGPDDGYAYSSSGNKVILFGNQYIINNSDYVQPKNYSVTGTDITYPEWYAYEIAQLEYFDVMAAAGLGVGEGGVNIFLDNHQLHSNKGGVSWDGTTGVGGNDNAVDYFDSEDPAHVAADPIATQAYSEIRANMRKAPEIWDTANPGSVTLFNTNQWSDRNSDRLIPESTKDLRGCILEYRADPADDTLGYNRTGMSENNSDNRPTYWPRSGVGANGLNRGQNGRWNWTYSNIYQSVRLSQSPHIIFALWNVECLASASTGDAGISVYPNAPAATAKWNMVRWAICTSWLAGAHPGISGIRVGTEKSGRSASTPVFDEYGLINGSVDYGLGSGSTKLYRKWMGTAIDLPPVTPDDQKADGSYQREFTNALIIVNPDNDEANSAITIDVSELPGGASEWKRFNGTQDSSTNDGTDASSDFSLDPIDAIVLVRKSWYDAL